MHCDGPLLAACVSVILFCIGTCITAIICTNAKRYAAGKYPRSEDANEKGNVHETTGAQGCSGVLGLPSRQATATFPFMGLLLPLLVARLGPSLACVQVVLLAFVLYWASVVDVLVRRIPDLAIMAALAIWVAGLVISWPLGRPLGWELPRAVVGSFGIVVPALLASLFVSRASGRPGLGGGDLKLFLVVGLYFGLHWGAAVVVTSCLLGLLQEMLRVVWERSRASGAAGHGSVRSPWEPGTFPLCPAVSCATVIVALVGGAEVLS